jgi:hypothetical protein
MIKKIDTIERYVDDETNARIDYITPSIVQEGKEAPEDPIFIGSAILGNPANPEQQYPIQFEIKDVETIEDAFGKFEESAKARIEEIEKEFLEEQRRQASALVGVDGKPIDENGGKEPLIFPPQG